MLKTNKKIQNRFNPANNSKEEREYKSSPSHSYSLVIPQIFKRSNSSAK